MFDAVKNLGRARLSLTFGAERRSVVAALVFVILLCVVEALVFRENFRDLLAFFSAPDNLVFQIICGAYLAGSLYLLFLLVLFAISSKWYVRVPLIAFFTLAVMAQAGYSNAVGRFTISQDIVSAISATSEQRSDSVFAYLSAWSVLPGIALTATGLFFRRPAKPFGVGAIAGLATAYALFFVNLSFVNPLLFERRFASNSVANVCLTGADFLLYDPVFVKPRRTEVEFAAPAEMRPAKNVVVIFDESVRGDHLSLNGYHRPTTPYLEELAQKKLLLNFGIASSSSTISHPSYDAFITGATPDVIEAVRYSGLGSLPTLFQYARAMNFRTHLIDGQMKRYWGGNEDDLKFIDNFVSLAEIDSPDRIEDWELGDKITNEDNERNQLKQWEIDRRIAASVRKLINESTGNFIFIYKRGIHFPYEKNYPAEAAVWKPIYRFREQYEVPPADQIDAVKNSYDNGLKYNLDDFFKNLASDYAALPNNTIIVYTADHGESFFAGGRAGHGGETREEAIVPFFLIGVPADSVDTGYRASHAAIFTTIVDLIGFPKNEMKGNYARSVLNAKAAEAPPRFFNPPKGQKIAFDAE